MIVLRRAKEQDIESIRGLANRTWYLAYSEIISVEQIEYMLEKMYNKGELLSQLEEGHVFLIAEQDGADLGFAGFSVLDPERKTYKLHKLYVLPRSHGKGIGKLLMNEVVNLVKRAGGAFLQLNVNKNNKAVDFYKSAGFTIKETIVLDIGNGFVMDDYIMEKPL